MKYQKIKILFYLILFIVISVNKTFEQSLLKVSRDKAIANLIIKDSTVRSVKAFFPIGQSNADGRIFENDWPEDLRDSLKSFKGYFHQDNSFYSAKAGFNVSDQGYWVRGDSTENGLEIPLYKYLKFFGKWKFLKVTRGGAPVTFFDFDVSVLPSSRDGYSIQLDSFLSISPEIDSTKSFWFWIQGETEAFEEPLDENYASDLQEVVYDVYSNIYNDLYGIMILTNSALDSNLYPNTEGIRLQQSQVARDNKMSIYDPTGLGLKDSVHYNADSYLKIAKELAIIYYKRFYNITLR